MKELKRQIVIFGDFTNITFNAQVELKEIVDKFNLTMGVSQDIFVGVQNVSQNNIVPTDMRPVLKTNDNKFSIFMGSKRIHIEEVDMDEGSYNDFLDKGIEIIKAIVNAYKIEIIRIALNGKLVYYENEIVNNLFNYFFKESDLYGESSEEFSFRINNVEEDKDLDSEINKIIAINRTNEILPEKNIRPILIIDYDYNTVYKENKTFNVEALNVLIKKSIVYKKVILEYGKFENKK